MDDEAFTLGSLLGAHLALQAGQSPVFDADDFAHGDRIAPHIVNALRAGAECAQISLSGALFGPFKQLVDGVAAAANQLRTGAGGEELEIVVASYGSEDSPQRARFRSATIRYSTTT